MRRGDYSAVGGALFLVLAACGWTGCHSEGSGTVCPASSPQQGESCDLMDSVRCFSDTGDCATSMVCRCRDGEFSCRELDWEAPCGDIQNASCSIEGRHGCVGYPTSGIRQCEQGAWQSFYSCPDACPIAEESGLPETGQPCSAPEGEPCDYGTTVCDCIGAEFSCHAP